MDGKCILCGASLPEGEFHKIYDCYNYVKELNTQLLKLLEEWLETPFFSDEHDWEEWAYPFSRRVEAAIAAAKGES
jgi:hypothetical protein